MSTATGSPKHSLAALVRHGSAGLLCSGSACGPFCTEHFGNFLICRTCNAAQSKTDLFRHPSKQDKVVKSDRSIFVRCKYAVVTCRFVHTASELFRIHQHFLFLQCMHELISYPAIVVSNIHFKTTNQSACGRISIAQALQSTF